MFIKYSFDFKGIQHYQFCDKSLLLKTIKNYNKKTKRFLNKIRKKITINLKKQRTNYY